METEKKSYEKKKESTADDKLQDFERELGERLYNSLDIVLPSMQFRLGSNRWISKVHIDGTPSSNEATCVYEDNPSWLKDWARGNKSLVWAVVDIEKKADNYRDALEYLCRIAGLDMPRLSDEQEAYVDFTRRIAKAQAAYHEALMTDPAPQAKAVRDYLIRRGWSAEDVAVSGLGYVSETTRKLLFTEKEEAEISQDPQNAMYYIGKNFTLAIPVFAGGRIETFKFRDIFTTDKKHRYRGPAGVGKDTLAYIPFRGQADTVIIVEGELDALHDRSMWEELGDTDKHRSSIPVVATGGGAATPNMIADAIKRGIYYFILAFDNDEHLELHTRSTAKNIHDAGGSAFVLDYPKGYKDLDEMYCDLIDGGNGKKKRRHDIYDIQRMAKDAISFGRWSANRILSTVAPDCGDMEKAPVKRKLSSLLSAIPSIDKKELRNYLRDACKPYGIDADSLSKETAKDTQNKALSDAYARVAKCYSSGNQIGAEIALKQARNIVSDEEEIKPVTPDSVMDELRQHELNTGVKTGWHLCGKELVLPSNGLSVFCLPSNHGKSAILTNICRLALTQFNKPVWFLHYEDDNATYMANLVKSWNNMEDDITVASLEKCGEDSVLRSAWDLFAHYRISGKLSLQETSLTVETLCEQALEAAKEEKLGCLIVDYIQLITTSEKRNTQKDTMTEVCRRLMRLSKQAHIPVVTAAQFNRNPKGPLDVSVHDIADAADIYNQSTCVVFGWNTSKMVEKFARGFMDDGKPDVSNPIISQLVHDGAKFNFDDDDAKTTLYLRVAKSRCVKTGGYGILKYNMASGRIEE